MQWFADNVIILTSNLGNAIHSVYYWVRHSNSLSLLDRNYDTRLLLTNQSYCSLWSRTWYHVTDHVTASRPIGCLYYNSFMYSCTNLWELLPQSLLSDCHGQVTHKHRPRLLTTDKLRLFCWGGTLCLHGNIGWRWCNSLLTSQGCGCWVWCFLVCFCGSFPFLVRSGSDINGRTNSCFISWSSLFVFIGNWNGNTNTQKSKNPIFTLHSTSFTTPRVDKREYTRTIL